MFKKKNKPRIKSKTMQVKSKSLIGKTQMDKAIEKYTNEGWELVEKKKVPNKDLYTLEWRYEMSQDEIAKEDRFNLIRNAVIASLIFLCCGLSYFQGQAIANQEATENVHATQTATFWTATNTSTATLIPSPTLTPSSTASSTITNTPQSTNTAISTNTSIPTQVITTTYYVQIEANIRECTQIANCPTIIDTYFSGTALEVVNDNITGDEFQGSTRWMEIVINGQTRYVHSALISTSPPVPTVVPQNNTSSTGNNTSSNNIQSVAPSAPGSSCSCSADIYNCTDGSFSSQTEAQACFDKCFAEGRGDVHGLDQNNDMRICEGGVR